MPKTLPPGRSHQPSVPALDWLDHSPQGSDLLHAAHALLALEAALAGTLPAALARHVRVAQQDGPRLTVMVPGAAHAARLRQMTAAATQRLQDAGWPIEQIIIRIDARAALAQTEKPQRETEPLGPEALQSFEALGRQVAPGALADAIDRLLKHHKA